MRIIKNKIIEERCELINSLPPQHPVRIISQSSVQNTPSHYFSSEAAGDTHGSNSIRNRDSKSYFDNIKEKKNEICSKKQIFTRIKRSGMII